MHSNRVEKHSIDALVPREGGRANDSLGTLFVADSARKEDQKPVERQTTLAPKLCPFCLIRRAKVLGIHAVVEPNLSAVTVPSRNVTEVGAHRQAARR